MDIPARALDEAFTYRVPAALPGEEEFGALQVGCCVLLRFGNRPALAYVVALSDVAPSELAEDKLKSLERLLSRPFFSQSSAELARWIAREYVAPLSEAIRLFTPPGATFRLQRDASGEYQLATPGAKPVQDRWAELTEAGRDFQPRADAARQQAVIAALRTAPMRVAELGIALSGVGTTLKALERRGMVRLWERRRNRAERPPLPPSQDIVTLTPGQRQALKLVETGLASLASKPARSATAGDNGDGRRGDNGDGTNRPIFRINSSVACGVRKWDDSYRPHCPPQVIVLDGVTGSGKTEVYLQAIRSVLARGGSAIVLVPEISLTPQTVARFRSRFGEQVAVLHSRLAAGERLDQWDLLRAGQARVAVGARSALFAPLDNLQLIIIDEEHESSYKQGSSPRYVSRDVAVMRARAEGAVVLLGSATPSLEALERVRRGEWQSAALPERCSGKPLPPVRVVDLAEEFRSGNTSMFSRSLQTALLETMERREKAVLLLNRRGFSSFLLCRDCGYVPSCENCSVSLTYHIQPQRLKCHHCGAEQMVPPACPQCGSRYLKQLGPGTQYAYDQLLALLAPGTPVVRMDADSTRGKDAHERLLDSFAAAPYGVLLGTQMIAKGLDFPEVTLVGVLIADTTLKFPDFRAGERTYQLLEQVAGRAGRKQLDGRVIVQSYWPEHLAIRAAAAHDRELFLAEERVSREQLRYPPFARLANILFWGLEADAVSRAAYALREALQEALLGASSGAAAGGNRQEAADAGWLAGGAGAGQSGAGGSAAPTATTAATTAAVPPDWQVIGPSPCLIARRKGSYRWHLVIKAPPDANISGFVAPILKAHPCAEEGVRVAVDIDPYDMI
ncbi:MAG: primosomal protein N' [Coriobacteriales bacterium]|nr:primosomal protein N' [Coriobacteriales bacterium]